MLMQLGAEFGTKFRTTGVGSWQQKKRVCDRGNITVGYLQTYIRAPNMSKIYWTISDCLAINNYLHNREEVTDNAPNTPTVKCF
jgi:hypothetical protein